ncbi:MAG: ChbG/HpnK family deacetylase [archaeon]|nr:ChbG/HpnK family deacetylase [archaeon]
MEEEGGGFLLDIVADDFGFCEARNRSILHCYEHGMVTRASMLVAFPAAKDGAKAAAAAGLPLGLHFNVTELATVCPPSTVSSLFAPAEDGSLHLRSKFEFAAAVADGSVLLEHVRQEFIAQM